MRPQDEPKGDSGSRGFLLVDDFCRIAGLDQNTIHTLFEAGRVEGITDSDGRAFGLFDDALPTRGKLLEWGLVVSDDYVPDQLRSYEDDSVEDEDDEEDAGPSWAMKW